MVNRFSTHFCTVVLLHFLVLMVGMKMAQDAHQAMILPKGPSVLKLQVGTRIFMGQQTAIAKQPKPKTVSVPKPSKTPIPAAVSHQTEKTQAASAPGAVTGDAPSAGGSPNGFASGTSANGTTDPRAVFKSELRAAIEKHKSYPAMSRRLGQTGTVVVAFTLLEDGRITNVKVDSPSRFDRLNESALEAVLKVQRFKPIPTAFGEQKMDIKVPVNFLTI